MNTDNLLSKLYYNPETGFGSLEKLYREAKKKNKNITRKKVKEFLDKQSTVQINKPNRNKKSNIPITGPVGKWNVDLLFYPKYKQQNNGFSIILTAINIHSKYAFAIPLKSKKKEDVNNAIKLLIKKIRDSGRKIVILHSDNGKEFKNKSLELILIGEGIEQDFCSESDHECNSIVERFNRTLKTLINKYLTYKNSVKWIDVLDKLMKNYNNRYHRTIKKSPSEVSKNEQKKIMFDKIEQTFDNFKPIDINVGDKVRLPVKKKSLFDKEGENYSREIYTVEKVNNKTIRVEGDSKLYKKDKVLKIPDNTFVPKNTRSRDTNKMKER